MNLRIILVHVGRLPFLHTVPLGSSTQVCMVVPVSVNPVSQVYVTTLPSSVPSVKLLPPLSGVPGSAQVTIKIQMHYYLVSY